MKYLTPIALTMASIVLSLAAPGKAEADPVVNINCKAPMTQLDMNRCAYLSFQAADQELNRVYRQFRNAGKQSKQEAQDSQLTNAQLAWIKYRDLDCKFSADRFKGGSMAPMMYNLCKETLTQQRTTVLKSYLEFK